MISVSKLVLRALQSGAVALKVSLQGGCVLCGKLTAQPRSTLPVKVKHNIARAKPPKGVTPRSPNPSRLAHTQKKKRGQLRNPHRHKAHQLSSIREKYLLYFSLPGIQGPDNKGEGPCFSPVDRRRHHHRHRHCLPNWTSKERLEGSFVEGFQRTRRGHSESSNSFLILWR